MTHFYNYKNYVAEEQHMQRIIDLETKKREIKCDLCLGDKKMLWHENRGEEKV